MQERVRLSHLEGQTLVSLCAAAGAAALPYQRDSELNGSGWQLRIMSAFAKPEHQVRGVLVVGPSRCGKSHVGHQLYKALPTGAVVKVQEADQVDNYQELIGILRDSWISRNSYELRFCDWLQLWRSPLDYFEVVGISL